MVVPTYHPSYEGSINSKIKVQISPGIKIFPIQKIFKGKKGWGHGSRATIPA
jgi:hypothetical protein